MKKSILFLIIIAFVSVLNAQIPTDGLIGYWPFNGNANDESGNGNNGTVNGATLTTDRFGNENSAFDFDGSNDYINIGSLNTAIFSYSVWIYKRAESGNILTSIQADIQKNYRLLDHGTGSGLTGELGNGTGYTYLYSGNSPSIDIWHLVVYMYDGSDLKIYLDGIQIGTQSAPTYVYDSANTWIGQNPLSGSTFDGKIDDLRMYNRILSMHEINSLYFEGQGPVFITHPQDQNNICIGVNVNFFVEGYNFESFQWQESTDNGNTFSDITDNSVYSGAQTSELSVITSTDLNNYQYRCIIDGDGYIDVPSNSAVLTIDSEDPAITCISNQTIMADDNSNTYTVQGTEFDPISTDDNCSVASVTNDFNSSSTLDGAVLSLGTTTIKWTVEDDAGNTNSCSFDVLVEQYENITELQKVGIFIYPNPSEGIFFVDTEDPYIISVMDITGKKLIEIDSLKGKTEIDLSDYAKGTYFIEFRNSDFLKVAKIIKN